MGPGPSFNEPARSLFVSLSIVIPARNAAASIAATLRSIADERDLIREVLVVDDSSSDQTAALACALGLDLNLPLTVIPVKFSNAGAARNAGIRCASGDLLFLLDADDELIRGGLRLLTERLLSDPEADIALGGYIRRTGGTRRAGGTTEKLRMPRSYGRDPIRNARDYLCNRHPSIAMGSALIRRRAVADAVFPESIAFDEDTLFWTAVLSRSRVVTVESPIMIYNVDAERMERRFTTTPRRNLVRISSELDKLRQCGIDAGTLSWRKGWLARRIARALIRQGRYAHASAFMRLAVAQHPRIRLSATTLRYWVKIRAGSVARRLR